MQSAMSKCVYFITRFMTDSKFKYIVCVTHEKKVVCLHFALASVSFLLILKVHADMKNENGMKCSLVHRVVIRTSFYMLGTAAWERWQSVSAV